MSTEFYLTKEKYVELSNELKYLKKYGRIEVADLLKKAKEFGDIFENEEFFTAREYRLKIETRILELENMLRNSIIIKKINKNTIIEIGSKVKIERNYKVIEYSIVGKSEANPEVNLISNESPIGKAIIGKKEGDTGEYDSPKGKMKFKIIKVS